MLVIAGSTSYLADLDNQSVKSNFSIERAALAEAHGCWVETIQLKGRQQVWNLTKAISAFTYGGGGHRG